MCVDSEQVDVYLNNLVLVMALALVLLLVLVMLLALAIQNWYSTKVADAVVACCMCKTNCSGFAIVVMADVVMTSGCYGSFVVQQHEWTPAPLRPPCQQKGRPLGRKRQMAMPCC